ncbi:TetR/AcrR family transcriptional regulator [Leucobacter sp. USHLN153]|uniref:TetR/AcrR family transcriptional regulator n=1 Tax=Leucobacter sp. USHLN153 TaxID=3081268 RepID=UPI00301B2905
MEQSAKDVRSRRRLSTERTLSTLARTWTAERGLAGYTVEELCEAAGVSRRTFFNYFASKEDAVLGMPNDRHDEHLTEAFLAGAADAERSESGLSVTLIDDFVELFRGRWEALEVTLDDAQSFFAALEREPKLHRRVFDHMRASELIDIGLIEAREGLTAGDPRASTLVHLIGAINRIVVEEYFALHERDPDGPPLGIEVFARMLRERVALARNLLR